MDVVVTGIGLLSCLGSLQPTWSSILQGKSGISPQSLFSQLPVYPLGLINSQPSQIYELTKKLLTDTLEDAKLTTPLPECGVVIGSSRGCQANWEELATQRHNTDSDHSISDWLQTPTPSKCDRLR